MRKHTRAAAAAIAIAVGVTGTAPALAADGPVEAGIFVDKVEGLSEGFMNGVDVSTVLSLEASGVVFRDRDGEPADLFAVLADHGVTDVRIRVWNDPYDDQGRGYGGGNVDVERAVQIGERATEAGMSVLVDFHYSDFWADPGKQMAPKAWEGMTVEQKAVATEEFTRDALQQFEDAGVDVTMVQVGNETVRDVADVGENNWDGMAAIFSAGSRAVREVLPDALVAVHFTNPERAGSYATFARNLDERDVDYDVFASSYYAYWHGTAQNLTEVLRHVAETYDKKVAVVETSWAYTLEDGDGTENVISTPQDEYPINVQGQATAIRDVYQAVADVGEAGIGVFYWEPAWLPVGPPEQLEQNRLLWERDGSGWATSYAAEYDPEDAGQYYGGSGWDNQALFAYDGTPHESLNIFNYVYTGAVAPLEVVSVEEPSVTISETDELVLPETVTVAYNDGSEEEQTVTWSGAAEWISGPGTYRVPGVTSAGLDTVATVVVTAANYLRNPGFEDADTSMWAATGSGLSVRSTENPLSGSRSASFWDDAPYSFTLTQVVEGLPAGSYVAAGSAQGQNSAGTVRIELVSGDQTAASTSELTGWQNWDERQTDPVVIPEGGSATVRIVGDGLGAGDWGSVDDLSLSQLRAAGADTRELEAALAEAEGVDRDRYTAESLQALDEALEIARIVLSADAPTAEDVAAALALLRAAIDGLVEKTEPPAPVPDTELRGSLSDDTVGPGDRVTVRASGFEPGESVEIWLHSEPVLLATVAADSTGDVTATVTIPASAEPGPHRLELRGADSGSLFLDLTITGALVATGTDAAAPVGLALLLLMLGAVAMVRRASTR